MHRYPFIFSNERKYRLQRHLLVLGQLVGVSKHHLFFFGVCHAGTLLPENAGVGY